jgi:hypothetical protein
LRSDAASGVQVTAYFLVIAMLEERNVVLINHTTGRLIHNKTEICMHDTTINTITTKHGMYAAVERAADQHI